MFEMVLSRRFLRVHATSGCPPKLTKKRRRRRATLIHLHPRAVCRRQTVLPEANYYSANDGRLTLADLRVD